MPRNLFQPTVRQAVSVRSADNRLVFMKVSKKKLTVYIEWLELPNNKIGQDKTALGMFLLVFDAHERAIDLYKN